MRKNDPFEHTADQRNGGVFRSCEYPFNYSGGLAMCGTMPSEAQCLNGTVVARQALNKKELSKK